MSDTEMVALVIAAALGGIGTGLGIAAIALHKRADQSAARYKTIDAYTHWLAARTRFTRSCMTFVSTFRALTESPSESQATAARRAEANHARAAWRSAAHELDAAEAELIAWSRDSSIVNKLAKHPRVSSRDIRSAIEADEPLVEDLCERLAAQDRLATEALRPDAAAPPEANSKRRLAIRLITRLLEKLDDMAARLARR